MGYMLHVAKKYQIEYSSYRSLNFETEAFEKLISTLGIAYYKNENCDDFEIEKKEWVDGIQKLKNLECRENSEEFKSALANLKEPLDEIIRLMELYLTEADENNEYMFLSFF